ncbi:MAG TPA: glycosyltransferase family 4 protein [Anaerolineae bacterium]|nr:glycosyltransferase family 4 protein [Anaerolineae bacterium]
MTLNLAYVSPLPPATTGIADYSADLIPHLATHTNLTLITNPQLPPTLSFRAPFNPLDTQTTSPLKQELNEVEKSTIPQIPIDHYPNHHQKFDLTLYQMGNSLHHQFMYPYLLRYPGVIMLHDYILHHFIHALNHTPNSPTPYAQTLGHAHGRPGLTLANQILNQQSSPPWFDLPLNQHLIDTSLALLTHSHYTANLLRAHRPDRPIHVIPQLMSPTDAPHLRAKLPWPVDATIIASAGQVTRNKQLDRALRAFARLRPQHPNLYYLIIGAPNPQEFDLDPLLTELKIHDAVHLTGYVPDLNTFIRWFHTADIIVNLRYPTAGETSATALRALAAARPLIVYDHGWYSELPATTTLKIPPQDDEALYQALHTLVTNPQQRRALGRAGQTHIHNHHQPATIAHQYTTTLTTLYHHLTTPT